MDPSYALEIKEIASLGVTPIRTLMVFIFAEKVQAWVSKDDGHSIKSSVACDIICVLG